MSELLVRYFENLRSTDEAELYLENENIDSDNEWLETGEIQDKDNGSFQESNHPSSSSQGSQREASQGSYLSSTDSETPPQVQESPEFVPEPEKKKFKSIPMDEKIRILNKAERHPEWSLETLQRNGCAALSRKDTLVRWKEEVKRGGTQYDRAEFIRGKTYERFVEL
ncbi:hypothetical protein QAD02_017276 [Eretmocerus hayati]|uniref:Uncharacterized protein n=1 Tax=Eretmocerus hayati TaxID=131215 RepID=A0ACC2PCZ7_9HYME|nr:hypothetical protein QAD02_017276 [Eretmocerus hayati]